MSEKELSPEDSIQLGFAEEPETSLAADTFPSKLGGRPAWLNPEHILDAEQLQCGVCEKIMVLLVQLYTPEDQPPESYHRTVYVFCCRNGQCHKESWVKCFKAFRSQLPRDNPYWPSDNSDSSSFTIPPSVPSPSTQMCIICGLRGTKACSRCHRARYCSREHQHVHWTIGKHKQWCSSTEETEGISEDEVNDTKQAVQSNMFPELEIVMEPEPIGEDRDDDVDDEAGDEEEGEETTRREGKSSELVPVGDETYENTKVDVDRAFLKFQKRIQLEPEQVLRYARVSYTIPNPIPLWATDSYKPTMIPPCPHCSSPRTFEFQILSTMLNHLALNHTASDSLDWGTLVIYTCLENCVVQSKQFGGQEYVEEFIWRQEFSEEGVKLVNK